MSFCSAAEISEDVEQADTLIVEFATLNDESITQVDLLRAPRIVIVYGFGPPELVKRMESKGCILLRAPVSWRVLGPVCYSGMTMSPDRHADGESQEALLDREPPKKKFTDRQLAHYLAISSTVRCECPRHVAELIIHLNRFEKYSAECENRSRDDAAMQFRHDQAAATAGAPPPGQPAGPQQPDGAITADTDRNADEG